MNHCLSDCPPDQGTFKKAKWQLGSKCLSSYSTLETNVASRILATTGGTGNQFSVPVWRICHEVLRIKLLPGEAPSIKREATSSNTAQLNVESFLNLFFGINWSNLP